MDHYLKDMYRALCHLPETTVTPIQLPEEVDFLLSKHPLINAILSHMRMAIDMTSAMHKNMSVEGRCHIGQFNLTDQFEKFRRAGS